MRVGPPEGWSDPHSCGAFDVWAGYLVLDALAGARDRHHQNWAIIERRGHRRLAPSFDHGNALGFQESDDRLSALASDPNRLRAWSRKGRSHHFAGRPGLVPLAAEALAAATPSAAEMWRSRLAALPVDGFAAAVDAVPTELMSDAARSFCIALVEHNRRRLLDGD